MGETGQVPPLPPYADRDAALHVCLSFSFVTEDSALPAFLISCPSLPLSQVLACLSSEIDFWQLWFCILICDKSCRSAPEGLTGPNSTPEQMNGKTKWTYTYSRAKHVGFYDVSQNSVYR